MFRPWVALVGSQVRASGPLQYPTIASMFLEIAFAFALGLMLIGMDAQRRTAAAIFLVVAAVIGQAIVFTFTRAGLITVASTLAIVAWLRYRRRGLDRGIAALAMVAVRVRGPTPVVAVGRVASAQADDGDDGCVVSGRDPGARRTATCRREAGRRCRFASATPVAPPWTRRRRSRFSSRITGCLPTTTPSSAGKACARRSPFVWRPGSTIALDALVEAPPEPGEYRLMWDVEQRHRLWFSTEPGAARVHVTRVAVSGPRVATAAKAYPHDAAGDGRCGPAAACSGVRQPACWPIARCSASVPTTTGCCTANPRACRPSIAACTPTTCTSRCWSAAGIVGGAAFAWLCWAAATRTGRRRARLARARRSSRQSAAIAAATVAIATARPRRLVPQLHRHLHR